MWQMDGRTLHNGKDRAMQCFAGKNGLTSLLHKYWKLLLLTIKCADGRVVVTWNWRWRFFNVTFVFLNSTYAANDFCTDDRVACSHGADGMETHTISALQHQQNHLTHTTDDLLAVENTWKISPTHLPLSASNIILSSGNRCSTIEHWYSSNWNY